MASIAAGITSEVAIQNTPLEEFAGDIRLDSLLVGEKIGEGNFAAVFKGTYNGYDVAVKKQGYENAEMAKYIITEVAILRMIKHDNLLKYVGSTYHKSEDRIYIVTEYLPGGNLREFAQSLRRVGGEYSDNHWNIITKVIKELASGLEYLHQHLLMHRDVKTENVILAGGGERAVWCDFGFARSLSAEGMWGNSDNVCSVNERIRIKRQMTICGTDEFMPPELQFGMEYSVSADIFSFGVLMAEIITGKPPGVDHLVRLPQNGFTFNEDELRMLMPLSAPLSLVELCVQCCSAEPDDRPTAADIVEWASELEGELNDRQSQIDSTLNNPKLSFTSADLSASHLSLHSTSVGAKVAEQNFLAIHKKRSSYINVAFEDRTFEIDLAKLVLHDCISRGKKSETYTGVYNSDIVAIKKIRHEHSHVDKSVPHDYLKNELSVLQQLVHPHLLKYFGAKFVMEERIIYVAMELLGGGTLRDFLLAEKGAVLKWRSRLSFAADLSSAVLHLHNRGLVHANIRTDKVLLSSGNRLVLCDFGFARMKLNEDFDDKDFNPFSAPEVLNSKSSNSKTQQEADIFSVGLVFLEIALCGPIVDHLFPTRNSDFSIAESLYFVGSSIPRGCPDGFFSLILQSCSTDPVERPGADVLRQETLKYFHELYYSSAAMSKRHLLRRTDREIPKTIHRTMSELNADHILSYFLEEKTEYAFVGILSKRGRWNTAWKARICAIGADRIEYFRLGVEQKIAPLGHILFSRLISVNGKIAVATGKNGNEFKICTRSRTYCFQAKNSEESLLWVNKVNDIVM